jgi:hypothetical protein
MNYPEISKDPILKKMAFEFMEEATKRGYWASHSIVFANNGQKTLTIEIQEIKHKKPLKYKPRSFNKTDQKILEIIKDNPGIKTGAICKKLDRLVCNRSVRMRLASLLERKLIVLKSKGNKISDPSRQFFPINVELKGD